MAQKKLAELLAEENVLLDKILESQGLLHAAVKDKNWVDLEKIMGEINSLTIQFSAIDTERDAIFETNPKFTKEEDELIMTLHSKLLKSKIQNQALNTYIETTQNFIRGVLDNAVPQRRNVLYSRDGKIVKSEPESVVLNKVL